MRKKIFRSLISITLSFLLVVNPVVVRVALGEELASQEQNTQTESTLSSSEPNSQETAQESTSQTQEESSQPQDTVQGETPASSDESQSTSSIETGDANATSSVDTTANVNEDTATGNLESDEGSCTPPEGETSCPEDIVISNTNEAQVSDSSSSTSSTGNNSISQTQGDAEIATGDATSSGTIDLVVNVNSLTFEGEEEATTSGEPTEEIVESTPQENSDEGKTLEIENSNSAEVENSLDSSADTGKNLTQENAGDSLITTGDAQALANIANLLNLNIVGSDFQIEVSDYEEGLTGDIDFNQLWRNLLVDSEFAEVNIDSSGNIVLFDIQNQNEAELTNNVAVSSNTGKNTSVSNQGDSVVKTGDAYSLANVVNFVNLNLFGSKFYLGIVNILRIFNGNLIIPRPDLILDFSDNSQASAQGEKKVVFENQNEAEITDTLTSSATTGNNTSSENQGNNTITTGNAQSQANSFSFVNTNIFRNNWFFLVINSLGNRAGKVFGWFSPSSVSQAETGAPLIYEQGLSEEDSEFESQPDQALINQITSEISFRNSNKATLKNNIATSANTGSNISLGNAGNSSIQTGNAFSLANLFNLVNLNVLGSRWFLGVVNILGDWQGDTIVAYPDLTIAIGGGQNEAEVGSTLEYQVVYKNQGYDLAKNVGISLTLPKGLTYISDTSGFTGLSSGDRIDWILGDLAAHQEGSFSVFLRVEPSALEQESTSFFPSIVKEVYAETQGKEAVVVTNVQIGTLDPETDLSNNTSSSSLTVFEKEDTPDNRLPVLEITAKNNVNDFVYPGDVVSFEVRIVNSGEVEARDAYFVQTLHNGVPGDFGKAVIQLGTLKPKQEGVLRFGVALSNGHTLPEGRYHTEAYVVGYAPNGQEVQSNTARTDFRIVYKVASLLIPDVNAEEDIQPVSSVSCQAPLKPKEDILPFVLLLLMSSMYISRWGRDKLALRQNEGKS